MAIQETTLAKGPVAAMVTPAATKPRGEAIPITGKELVQMLLAKLAEDLSKHQSLTEINAYPGAKVVFALEITSMPVEEDRKTVFKQNYVLDFSNPPDVLRILAGLPVWETAKVMLDKYVQQVEREAMPSEELKAAALKVAGGGQVSKGGR